MKKPNQQNYFYFNYICSQIKNVFSIGKNSNNNIAPVLGQGVPAILTINIAHLIQQHVGEIGTYTQPPLIEFFFFLQFQLLEDNIII